MSTTTDNRLDETHRRIDELEARAQTAGDGAKQSFKDQVAALRQHEASARASAREAHEARTRDLSAHAEAAEAKLELLETRLKTAHDALSAELAEDKQTFTDAMDSYLEDFKSLSSELTEKAKSTAGGAREQADSAIGDIRRSRDTVAERLAEVRTASGERWRESKQSVAAARAELERKADHAMKKLK